MIPGECIEQIDVSKIKVEELGKSAVIINGQRLTHNRIRVDGCVVKGDVSADFVIERGDEAVIIELKGKNVVHGAEQILNTAKKWITEEHRSNKVCGLLVATQYPKASTSIQLRQQKFSKFFGTPLHVVTKNCEYQFEHLFSFRGPFKN